MKIYAFSDEAAASLTGQIAAMKRNGLNGSELRGVDGGNVSDLSPAKAKEVLRRLKDEGLDVWSLGSPIGKIHIETGDWPAHLERFRRTLENACLLESRRIRLFSFYLPKDARPEDWRGCVIDRMAEMAEIAAPYGVLLCHENEKGIYGDTDERCQDMLDRFGGRLGFIFDPANFIQCGVDPLRAFERLHDRITYMHIKDAVKNGTVVPSGMGAGCIPEILAVINQAFTGDFVLTLEPHLRVFAGLEQLEAGHRSVVGSTYETAADAFSAAAEHLRWCVPRTAELI
jgi:sugar phosphate isomerase/epimerase